MINKRIALKVIRTTMSSNRRSPRPVDPIINHDVRFAAESGHEAQLGMSAKGQKQTYATQ